MNEEELPTQPETTPEEATAETAATNPSSVPDDPPPEPPPPPDPITPEAEPAGASMPEPDAPATPTPVCTKHTVVVYDGPSDTLVLRIKRGERFLVIPELDPIIDSLIANGHVFIRED